jgi:hypothetical protein
MLRLIAAIIFVSNLLAAEPMVGTWDLDIAKSRIDNPEVLKGMEMTFSEKEGGWLIWADVQYRVNGQVLGRQISMRLDGAEHPIPERPGVIATTARLDANTIQRIEKSNGRVRIIVIDSLLPDGTLLQLVHLFKPDGALLSDETQLWRRK